MLESGIARPGTMAAILGDTTRPVEQICEQATMEAGLVVPANYNSPGQIVLSGEEPGVDRAMQLCKDAGAKRAIRLNVSGAFHSPLMQSCRRRTGQSACRCFSLTILTSRSTLTSTARRSRRLTRAKELLARAALQAGSVDRRGSGASRAISGRTFRRDGSGQRARRIGQEDRAAVQDRDVRHRGRSASTPRPRRLHEDRSVRADCPGDGKHARHRPSDRRVSRRGRSTSRGRGPRRGSRAGRRQRYFHGKREDSPATLPTRHPSPRSSSASSASSARSTFSSTTPVSRGTTFCSASRTRTGTR